MLDVVFLDERVHYRILEKKNRIDKHRPLHPDLVKRLEEQVLVEYIHSSNSIEGSTFIAVIRLKVILLLWVRRRQ